MYFLDGLIDCADSECCLSGKCENHSLCQSAADPLDILLRKQPPAITASFFERMQFLIEEESLRNGSPRKIAINGRYSVEHLQLDDLDFFIRIFTKVSNLAWCKFVVLLNIVYALKVDFFFYLNSLSLMRPHFWKKFTLQDLSARWFFFKIILKRFV